MNPIFIMIDLHPQGHAAQRCCIFINSSSSPLFDPMTANRYSDWKKDHGNIFPMLWFSLVEGYSCVSKTDDLVGSKGKLNYWTWTFSGIWSRVDQARTEQGPVKMHNNYIFGKITWYSWAITFLEGSREIAEELYFGKTIIYRWLCNILGRSYIAGDDICGKIVRYTCRWRTA